MKNIKNLFGFNRIKSKKNKTLLLAGLIGLLPACKQQINEPENPTEHPNTTSYTYDVPMNDMPVDSFMKHVPNVENVKFYQPREDNHYIHFSTDFANGNINKMTEERDVAQTSTNFLYPLNFNRTDNQSVNGTAHFVSEPTWNYTVSYKTPNNETRTWTIEDIPENLYNNYANLTHSQMSVYARNTILGRDSTATAHADSVWSNIYSGRSGTFTQNNPFTVQFNSKGAQQGLQHSDFGTFTYTNGAESETQMYSAANIENSINVFGCPAASINMTAFANVKKRGPNADNQQLVLTTGKDSARYVIDAAKNETIVMPFKNWYTMTIIRTPNRVYSYLTDSANIVPSQWQFIHTSNQENEYTEKVQPNGLFCTDGVCEYDSKNGFRTSFSPIYFMEPNGDVEVVGQGYREDYTNTDRVVVTFCFGGTNRTNDNGTATGLELIYCAPQHQR